MKSVLLHYLRVGFRSRHITGFMHDAVEDGWWPRWAMWRSLDAITRRDHERYFDYIKRVSENEIATRVKLVDLHDNLTRNGGPSTSLRKRYERAVSMLK